MVTKKMKAVGKIMECPICDGRRIFYRIGVQQLPNGRFMLWNCNKCQATIAIQMPERTYEQIKRASDAAFEAYHAIYKGDVQPVPQAAIDAAHEAFQAELTRGAAQ